MVTLEIVCGLDLLLGHRYVEADVPVGHSLSQSWESPHPGCITQYCVDSAVIQQPDARRKDVKGLAIASAMRPALSDWCENAKTRSTARMTVVDISGAGAAVLADRCPTVDQTVWIRLDSGAAGSERLEARVVATSAEASGKHIVRLQFTSWLPFGERARTARRASSLAALPGSRDPRHIALARSGRRANLSRCN